jgi:hypothetical protein
MNKTKNLEEEHSMSKKISHRFGKKSKKGKGKVKGKRYVEIENKMSHIKYRHKLIDSLRNPNKFNNFK